MARTEYTLLSDIQHVKNASMFTGLFSRNAPVYALDDDFKIYRTSTAHSPALRKLFDELLTNASDEYLRFNKVTQIRCVIDANGEIEVFNDGGGIAVERFHDAEVEKNRRTQTSNQIVYKPEAIFSMLRCGSSLNENANKTLASAHGLGAKLTNIHSDRFILETLDMHTGLLYTQVFENGNEIIHPPTIIPFKGLSSGYVKIRYLPTYSRFEYTSPPSAADMKEIIDITRMRLAYTSAFLGRNVNITLNGKKMNINNIQNLLIKFLPENSPTYATNFTTDRRDTYMDIAISVVQPVFKATANAITVVNGMVVDCGGSHFTYIRSLVNAELKKMKSDFKASDLVIAANIRMHVDGWDSQSKNSLNIKTSIFKMFTYDETFITKAAKLIITYNNNKTAITRRQPRAVDKKTITDKYQAAKSTAHPRILMLAEGDSAMGTLKRILAQRNGNYNINNTGIFSLGGVPPNIDKQIEKEDEANHIIQLRESFYESKTFGALVSVLGLKVNTQYTSVKKLQYSSIIICTDADLDGRGCICSLVLNMFYHLWPSLFELGFVTIWNSPVLRVLNGAGAIKKEFCTETEFHQYVDEGHLKPNDRVKYLKGLASHDSVFIPHMSARFHQDVIIVTVDETTKTLFNIYYSNDSSKRKEKLSVPAAVFESADIMGMINDRIINCSRHLDIHLAAFMQYGLLRTLKAFDGLTPVSRKVLTTLRKMKSKTMRVFQVAGAVANEMKYHHGDKSINDAIIKMAQAFPGSNNIPLLIKEGEMGSRNRKGKDAGSSRYVSAKLNRKLLDALFPKRDFDLLPKQEDEGVEVEPRYFLPVLPLVILELTTRVSYGWNQRIYPRDVVHVAKTMLKLINNKTITDKDRNLRPSRQGYNGNIDIVDGVIVAEGKFTFDEKKDIITVTELPLWIEPANFAQKYAEDERVDDINNYTTDDSVEIVMKMKTGVVRELGEEGIRNYLKIVKVFKEQLNIINEVGVVESFASAYDVLYKCFVMNVEKYKKRIERESLLLKYIILREENIIKLAKSPKSDVNTYKQLCEVTEEQAVEILKKDGYVAINTTAINTASNYSTEALANLFKKNQSYDYLYSVGVSHMNINNLNKRINDLELLKAELQKLENAMHDPHFPGSQMFKEDVEACIRALDSGRVVVDGS